MKKYLLNISTGTIHNGDHICHQGKVMAKFKQKCFDDYSEAVNYFDGKGKKDILAASA